jgi:quercetin dioxygenase-like cupin family protein
MNPLLQRQFLQGTNATFVKWTAKKGAVIALHHHPNEQITWFTAGAAEAFSQGRRYLIKAATS